MHILEFLKQIWVASAVLIPSTYRARRPAYLFLPINGAGLGHVTRLLSVAKELRRIDPEASIVFLTTSVAVHLVYREGFTCHHVPPMSLLASNGSAAWHKLFYRVVCQAMATHKISTLIFDGSAPYIGLQRIMARFKRVRFIWVKRGLYKTNVDQEKLSKQVDLFASVIAPREFGEKIQAENASPKVLAVAPIVSIKRESLLTKSEVFSRLRLNPLLPCVYVQLGAGNINEIVDLQNSVVRLLRSEGYQVVVGQSPIALSASHCDLADREIVDYPNSQYFDGFNFAVLAAGYNSVCEAVSLGLPAIFLPNQSTQADDQVLRASMASTLGPYECITAFSDALFLDAVSRLVVRVNSDDKWSVEQSNGAEQAAKIIAGFI